MSWPWTYSHIPIAPICSPIGRVLTVTGADALKLRLVEVLENINNSHIVCRAVDITSGHGVTPYTVRCLAPSSCHQTGRRESYLSKHLHRFLSSHPGVLTLRVLEEEDCVYIITEHASDHHLGAQILEKCRYLGVDTLIRDIFLQLIDAVQHCHSLGIYHQDLKAENILCFDDGLRIAITNFEHATTDKLSRNFRTDRLYHISPECRGIGFVPTGNFSSMFSDIWSLAIILLYIVTGRLPWKSASYSDDAYQAYLRDPSKYLLETFPISTQLNEILVGMLKIDWRQRMNMRDVRSALEQVSTFYSEDVIFDDYMAWRSCQHGTKVGSDTQQSNSNSPPFFSTLVAELQVHGGQGSNSDTQVSSSSSHTSQAQRPRDIPERLPTPAPAMPPHMRKSSAPAMSTGHPPSSIFSDYLPSYVPSLIDWTEDGNYNLVAAALGKGSIRSYTPTSAMSSDYGTVFFARSLRMSSTSLSIASLRSLRP